jgi:hypothetical protein
MRVPASYNHFDMEMHGIHGIPSWAHNIPSQWAVDNRTPYNITSFDRLEHEMINVEKLLVELSSMEKSRTGLGPYIQSEILLGIGPYTHDFPGLYDSMVYLTNHRHLYDKHQYYSELGHILFKNHFHVMCVVYDQINNAEIRLDASESIHQRDVDHYNTWYAFKESMNNVCNVLRDANGSHQNEGGWWGGV